MNFPFYTTKPTTVAYVIFSCKDEQYSFPFNSLAKAHEAAKYIAEHPHEYFEFYQKGDKVNVRMRIS